MLYKRVRGPRFLKDDGRGSLALTELFIGVAMGDVTLSSAPLPKFKQAISLAMLS